MLAGGGSNEPSPLQLVPVPDVPPSPDADQVPPLPCSSAPGERRLQQQAPATPDKSKQAEKVTLWDRKLWT